MKKNVKKNEILYIFGKYSTISGGKTMMTIYHNPKCRKSRAGLQYIQDKGLEFTVIEYLKTPLTRDELKDLLMKLNMRPLEIVRTQEDEFKEKLKGKHFTDEEWITILLENPKLIQRPIVVKNHKAVLGQPVEEIDRLIGGRLSS